MTCPQAPVGASPVIASLAALAAPTAIYAQEAPDADGEDAFDLTTTLTATSDYRFRGVSLSQNDPAAQASVELAHKSGFYAGAWGSTIKGGTADVELDLYGGWRGSDGGLWGAVG